MHLSMQVTKSEEMADRMVMHASHNIGEAADRMVRSCTLNGGRQYA